MDDSLMRINLLHTGNKKTPIIWGKYHTHCKGWSDTGYHFVITKDGTVHKARPLSKMGAHARGFNKASIGICLTGDKEFSDEQFESLRALVKDDLIPKHELSIIDVIGHNELNGTKSCPNFDVLDILRQNNESNN
jgi:N-acetyl-anhydromuramyl-L-alanine amidase AmpD